MFLALKFAQPKAMHRAKSVVYEVADSLEITMTTYTLQDGTFLVSASQTDLDTIQAAVNRAMHETMFPRSPHDTMTQLPDSILSHAVGRIEIFFNFLQCGSSEEAQAVFQKVRSFVPADTPHFKITISRKNSVKVTGDSLSGLDNLIHDMENISIK